MLLSHNYATHWRIGNYDLRVTWPRWPCDFFIWPCDFFLNLADHGDQIAERIGEPFADALVCAKRGLRFGRTGT